MEWIEPKPISISDDLRSRLGGRGLLAEALARRGITTWEEAAPFLNPQLYAWSSPFDLPDMDAAVERLSAAIRKREQIGVWGDFDVDGQTAASVLVSSLRALDANVSCYIPVRGRESHGVHVNSLNEYLDTGVQLLLTCDTGITSHEAVEAANRRGVDVLITDHHTLPPELPPALAAVNPQRLPPRHPLSSQCGVGTAYQLVSALCSSIGSQDIPEKCLDLVALGTVADVAALTGDNRPLVQKGLSAMRSERRPAIQALLDCAEVEDDWINEEHIGFILAPRLNAIGRLGDANAAVDFLTLSSYDAALPFARQLETYNSTRKLLCDQVFQAAQSQIQQNRSLLDSPILILQHPQWHSGVIGIVASRLVELYQRPAILMTSPPGEPARASARSVEGINITAAIAACQEYLLGFGGHPMAAGFALLPENLPSFKRKLQKVAAGMAAANQVSPRLQVECYLDLGQVNLELVEELDSLSPFGSGNPSPVFVSRGVQLESSHVIGKGGEHRTMVIFTPSGIQQKVLWWNGAASPLPEGRFDLAYTLRASNFRGQRQVQAEWINYRPAESEVLTVSSPPVSWEIHDLRQADPEEALASLPEGTLIWCEGGNSPEGKIIRRGALAAGDNLAIWSIPPGRGELSAVVQAVHPTRLFVFAVHPGLALPCDFLARLGGLLRHALGKLDGEVDLERIAAALAARTAAARLGIQWYAASGHLSILAETPKTIHIQENGQADHLALARIEKDLKQVLHETEAFRSYYQKAPVENLLT